MPSGKSSGSKLVGATSAMPGPLKTLDAYLSMLRSRNTGAPLLCSQRRCRRPAVTGATRVPVPVAVRSRRAQAEHEDRLNEGTEPAAHLVGADARQVVLGPRSV